MAWLDSQPLWLLGLLLFGLFWLAAFVGRALHRKVEEGKGDAGLVVSSSLGLLALLLGFTVSMAVSRYDLRRQATLQEANAIGTFLYRTDLMPPELRRQTLAALDGYVEARLRVGRMGEDQAGVEAAKAITRNAAEAMWRNVMVVRTQLPDPAVQLLLVESANMMFDMATARDAALANRLPPTLVLLLIFFPVASLILIGYVSGQSIGVHLMASTELILLLTLVLLLIADLNRPRSGTILTPMVPIEDVAAQLNARQTTLPS
ncbi:MAG: hypothetical protein ACK4Z0_09060 [Sphingomonadaceae bacterium]